jgi:protein-L-isoaspartate(D-aspartate) O-methyltransferase
MLDYPTARHNMVISQLHPNGVITPAVLAAFDTVPREQFVPEPLRPVCYRDTDLDLGDGRVLIAPLTLARMIDAAGVQPGDTVLTIGGATGYGAAVMGRLATDGSVTDVDSDARFDALLQAAVQTCGLCNVRRVIGDMITAGKTELGYDVIIVQGAVADVPTALTAHLKRDGRLVVPVIASGATMGQAMMYTKGPTGHISSRPLFDTAVPYLPGFIPHPKFSFA